MSPITLTIFAVTLAICLTSSYGRTSTTSPTNHPASLDHTPRPIDEHRLPTSPADDEQQMTHDDNAKPEALETTKQRTDDRNRTPSDASEETPAKQTTDVRNVSNKSHAHHKVGKSKGSVDMPDMTDSREAGVLPSHTCPSDKWYNPATGQCEDKTDEPTEYEL